MTHNQGKLKRVGPKMASALQFVADRGGVTGSKLDIADWVGPNGSRKYGYEIVRRCLQQGLVTIDPDHPEASKYGGGAVVLTDAGRAALEAAN